MLKIALLAISLVISGCGTSVPDFPEIYQCAYSIKFNKFRCVNTKTKEAINLKRDDASMEGAQCLSRSDYKKSESWVNMVIKLAKARCK